MITLNAQNKKTERLGDNAICVKCGKPNDREYKGFMTCSACSAYWKEYYAKNREECLAKRRKRYAEDPEYRKASAQRSAKWRMNEKIRLIRATAAKRLEAIPNGSNQ